MNGAVHVGLLLVPMVNVPDGTHTIPAPSAIFIPFTPVVYTVKVPGAVAVPPGVVKVTTPLTAPSGTIAVTELFETPDIAHVMPFILTAVVLVRLVPVIVITVPILPPSGDIDEIAGIGITVMSVTLTAVPPGVITVILPVTAPVGTIAFSEVSLILIIFADAILLNITDVAPVRLVPVMVTYLPVADDNGRNELIVGCNAAVIFTVLAADTISAAGLLPFKSFAMTVRLE